MNEINCLVGYCYDHLLDDVEGCHPDVKVTSAEINSAIEMAKFIEANVQCFPEIKIFNTERQCVMHIVSQSLVYPEIEELKPSNIWDQTKRCFVVSFLQTW